MLLFNTTIYLIFIVMVYFNTSNVTIQQKMGNKKGTYHLISIHLMLLFNFTIGITFERIGNFNTSNVTIQLP